MNRKPKGILLAITIAVVPQLLLYFYSSKLNEQFFNQSQENFKECLIKAKAKGLSFEICDMIKAQTDSIYHSATAFYYPIVLLLLCVIAGILISLSFIKKTKEN